MYQLSKFAMLRSGAGHQGGTTITIVGSNTSMAETIALPASLADGDIGILQDYASEGGDYPSDIIPSGWNRIGVTLETIGTRRLNISYKVLTAAESSGTVTGMNGGSFNTKALYVFRKDAGIWTGPHDVTQEATDGNPVSQTCNAGSAGSRPCFVIGAYASTGVIDPRTFTPTADDEITPFTSHYLKYRIDNSSASNTTIDMADEGLGNCLSSFYFMLT